MDKISVNAKFSVVLYSYIQNIISNLYSNIGTLLFDDTKQTGTSLKKILNENSVYEKALKNKGDSGVNLVRMLELRLDNVLYRAGFGKSRAATRQEVSHSHLTVNGKKVNIPSYQVKPGDIIGLQVRKVAKVPWKALGEDLKSHENPSWMNVNKADLQVKITSLPSGEELKQAFDPKLIIEYYSR